MRLLADMLEEGAPGRTAEARRAARRTLVGFHVKHSADADPFYRLEIGGDAIAGDIAVERKPINPWPGRSGRIGEPIGELLCAFLTMRGQHESGDGRCREDYQSTFLYSFHWRIHWRII